jgi:hypothetical protein
MGFVMRRVIAVAVADRVGPERDLRPTRFKDIQGAASLSNRPFDRQGLASLHVRDHSPDRSTTGAPKR